MSDGRGARAATPVRHATATLAKRLPPADHGAVRRRIATLAVLAATAVTALAAGAVALAYPTSFGRVAGNPADALAHLPIEAFRYDRATHCKRGASPGAASLVAWLARNVRGVSWGITRCELWGRRSASLHAEGRAVDWHLDAARPADARAARRLIALLLAPDRHGRPAALARRMGVQEIIWDCRAWFGGQPRLTRYSACRPGKKVGRTIAHRDHVHIGLTRNGAKRRTSFWTRRSPALADRETRPRPDPGFDALPDLGVDPDLGLDDPLAGDPGEPALDRTGGAAAR